MERAAENVISKELEEVGYPRLCTEMSCESNACADHPISTRENHASQIDVKDSVILWTV